MREALLRLIHVAANLTSWGYQDCARDPKNGSFGAALPKLLLRHLPRHYPANSVYALFPFFTPTVNERNLKKLQINDLYTYKRPKTVPISKVVNSSAGVQFILENTTADSASKFKQMSNIKGAGKYVMSLLRGSHTQQQLSNYPEMTRLVARLKRLCFLLQKPKRSAFATSRSGQTISSRRSLTSSPD
jgi:hypothetical protein